MKHLLVTGAAGFLGRHVVNAAHHRGWRVVAIDRRGLPDDGRSLQVQHDITPASPLPPLPMRVDAAILAAWPITPQNYLESPDNVAALHATIATAQQLLEQGCRRLIGIGTCAEYAINKEVRTDGLLNEEHPTRASCLYAACKISARMVIEQLCRIHDAQFVWARIFNPYGLGEPAGRLVPAIVDHVKAGKTFAAGSGSQARDYVAAEDIGLALAMLADAGVAGDINVCTGIPIKLHEVMSIAACAAGGNPASVVLGAKADRAWDPPWLVGDPARLKALGWTPRDPRRGLTAYAHLLASRP